MVDSINQLPFKSKTEELQFQAKLENAKTRAEKIDIFKEYGFNPQTDNNNEPVKGYALESKTTEIHKDAKITNTKTSGVYNINNIAQELGIEPQALTNAIKDAQINVDENSNVLIENDEAKAKLETAINSLISKSTVTKFGENSDPSLIQYCTEQGIIEKNTDGSYTIKDQEKLKQFTQQTEETNAVSKQTNISGKEVTTEEYEEDIVKVADNLKHNRAGRKKAREDYKSALNEWTKDPENQATMMISIAKNKYSKEISKKTAKILTEYNNKKSDIELFNDYMKNYASNNEKIAMAKALNEVAANVKDEDLLNALHNGNKGSFGTKDLNNKDDKFNALVYYVMQNSKYKFDKTALAEQMATAEVMDKKYENNPDKFEKDKKQWINDEAKRQVKAAETKQIEKNTKIYFSEEDRKTAEKDETNPAAIHNDIGKYGRKLVKKCPQYFADKCSSAEADFIGDDGKPYKFNEGLFREFCSYACDGNVNNLSDDAKQRFGIDSNLTLNEGRNVLKQKIFKNIDGNPRSIEQLMGNASGKVSNGELNKFRHLIETSGKHVDKNSTNAKRALSVATGIGIGAAFGGFLGFVGSELGGSIIGQGAEQILTATGSVTGDAVINNASLTGPAELNGKVITTDYINDKWGGFESTHETPVTLKGDVTLTGDVSGKGTIENGEITNTFEGQKYKDHANSWKAARNGMYSGGISGGIGSLINMGKVHANGKNFDGIVNLTQKKQKESSNQSNLNLNINTNQTVITITGNVQYGLEGYDNVTLKNRKQTKESVKQNTERLNANHIHSEYGQTTHTGNNYKIPDEINSLDTTSLSGQGQHDYKLRLLTEEEVTTCKQNGQLPQDATGPFYTKVSVTDRKNNKDISNGSDIYRLANVLTVIEDGMLKIKYEIEQDEGYLGAGKSAAKRQTVSRYWPKDK